MILEGKEGEGARLQRLVLDGAVRMLRQARELLDPQVRAQPVQRVHVAELGAEAVDLRLRLGEVVLGLLRTERLGALQA